MKENAGEGGGWETDPEELCSLAFNPSMLLGCSPTFMVAPGSAVDSGDANLRVTKDETVQIYLLLDSLQWFTVFLESLIPAWYLKY